MTPCKDWPSRKTLFHASRNACVDIAALRLPSPAAPEAVGGLIFPLGDAIVGAIPAMPRRQRAD